MLNEPNSSSGAPVPTRRDLQREAWIISSAWSNSAARPRPGSQRRLRRPAGGGRGLPARAPPPPKNTSPLEQAARDNTARSHVERVDKSGNGPRRTPHRNQNKQQPHRSRLQQNRGRPQGTNSSRPHGSARQRPWKPPKSASRKNTKPPASRPKNAGKSLDEARGKSQGRRIISLGRKSSPAAAGRAHRAGLDCRKRGRGIPEKPRRSPRKNSPGLDGLKVPASSPGASYASWARWSAAAAIVTRNSSPRRWNRSGWA